MPYWAWMSEVKLRATMPYVRHEPISEADYIPRLTRVMAARPAGDRLLFFTADDRPPYGKVVTALDGAQVAGAEVLGLMTAPP
jgi:biopolymer transport protein ExbD